MAGSQFFCDKYTKCPYYLKESPIDIRCEGIVSRSTTINFNTKAEKLDYKDDFCKGLYQSCIIFQTLAENEQI